MLSFPKSLLSENEKCWAHSKGCSMERHVVMFPSATAASVGGDHGCQNRGRDEFDGLCKDHHGEIFGE